MHAATVEDAVAGPFARLVLRWRLAPGAWHVTAEGAACPRARLRLFDPAALAAGGPPPWAQLPGAATASGLAAEPPARGVAVYSRTEPERMAGAADSPHWRRMPDEADVAAQELFAVLRELDTVGVSTIWVECPPADSAWDGVRDRLQRAAA